MITYHGKQNERQEVSFDWCIPRETTEIPGVGTFYKDELVERVSSLERVE